MKDTHISAYELMKKVPNRFLLTIAAARRARQIKEGAMPLVTDTNPEQPVISSLYEILEGKVGVELTEYDEKEHKRLETARRKRDEEKDTIKDRKDTKPRRETKAKRRDSDKGKRKKKSRSLAA